MEKVLYNKFSVYLKEKYGEKVYKLPVNIPVTCPNRDGTLSDKGCLFCGEEGAGFEMLSSSLGIKEQLEKNADYIGKNYKAGKYIAYFQNYTNTYLPLEEFKNYIRQACIDDVVAVYISTRPDCIRDDYLEFLAALKSELNVDIVMELGMQTANYHTLKELRRGHTLAEVIDSVCRINKYSLETCVHYILDIPTDTIDDVIEGSKIISALNVKQVKCHSLYILKDTELGDMYLRKIIKPIPAEDFAERAVTFLEYLNPEIIIQRLVGRAPKERTLFCNWGKSWWKVQEEIEKKMISEGSFQGKRFNYLNGDAIMKIR